MAEATADVGTHICTTNLVFFYRGEAPDAPRRTVQLVLNYAGCGATPLRTKRRCTTGDVYPIRVTTLAVIFSGTIRAAD